VHKCILLPTDGSENCKRAVDYGIAVAKQSGAKIVALTVTQPLHTGTPKGLIPAHLRAVIHDETAKQAREALDVVEAAAKTAGLAVESVHASHDRAWEEIVRVAKEKDCDLIVMASHGRRGAAALILGSETQKVLTHTTIPVLVVR
jgi:nucleotide-binding universal stress UspA family protein